MNKNYDTATKTTTPSASTTTSTSTTITATTYLPVCLEQGEQVEELTVQVPHHDGLAFELKHVVLLVEDFLALITHGMRPEQHMRQTSWLSMTLL